MRAMKYASCLLSIVLVAAFLQNIKASAVDTLSTTNLILNVDGTISASYSGSGPTWTDRSSAGNNLTAGGGTCSATLPSWNSSEGGGSFQFTTDKSCFKKDTFSAAPTNFSLFFWIKPTALPAVGSISYLAQINRDSILSNQEYMFGYNSSGQLYFWDYDSGYGYQTVSSSISSTKITVGDWQYVGFVKNGTSGSFYIGKAGSIGNVGNVTAAKSATYGTSSFVIGYDYRDNNNFFKGYMGAIHYYGSALSSATVSTNYSATLRATQQTIAIASLGTSSKAFPYSQALNISTSGSSGTGAKSYAVTNGTATGCALSDTSTATATLTASTSGTCLVTATIAADAIYSAATSSAQTFTFSKAAQTAITITTTAATYGSNLTLISTGGSTGGTYNYSKVSGNCTLSGAVLTPTATGSCIVQSNLAANANYLDETSTATTISIVAGSVSASLALAPGNLVYRQAKNITAIASVAGKVTFRVAGKILPGCKNKAVTSGNFYTAICSYRPSNHSYVTISATLDPTDNNYTGTVTRTAQYLVTRRTGAR
jgi:hypothetical protein